MAVCNLKSLENLTLKDIEHSIVRYCGEQIWIRQFNKYFWETRINTPPRKRTIELLNIVRGSGWNMNRQGQCAHITQSINSGLIPEARLRNFWEAVDALANSELRDLPLTDPDILQRAEASINSIRRTLNEWHPSAGTICFLTKVILMFNWGQTPAFDTRIRTVLQCKYNDMSTNELLRSLVKIGSWIVSFEKENEVQLDDFSTRIMNRELGLSLRTLPVGRSFDMLLFSLA